MPVKSKKQWRWMAINNPDMLKSWQKEHPVKFSQLPEEDDSYCKVCNKIGDECMCTDKLSEQEVELGLISRKNLDELLNDEILHSYFADADNFDKYFQDINEFFASDNALTLNQLSQFLENLGYGPKTIELSLEILSKSDEDRAKEKELTKKGIKEGIEFKYVDKNNDAKIEKFSSDEDCKSWLLLNKDKIGNIISYRPINEVLGPLTSDYKVSPVTKSKDSNIGNPRGKGTYDSDSSIKVTSPDKSFADMLKQEINNIKEEMTKTKSADKLIELNKKLDKLINEAFQLQEEFMPTYEGLISVAKEFSDEYKISHPNYMKDIEKFWYENTDNNNNFLPQYPSNKRKQIYWESIASIIEDYQDYLATDIRQMGKN